MNILKTNKIGLVRSAIIICCSMLFGQVNAQSKFSQFYAVPTLINPANVGRFNNDYRINMITQKQNITSISFIDNKFIGADVKFSKKGNEKNDFWGIGVSGDLENNTSDGIKNVLLSVLVGYTKSLNEENTSFLSLGFKGSSVRKTIKKRQYITEGDIRWLYSNGFTLDNAFTFQGAELKYNNLSTGIIFQGGVGKKNMYSVGITLNNVTKPKVSFNTGFLEVKPEYIANILWESLLKNNEKIKSGFLINYIGDRYDYLITGFNFEKYLKSYIQIIAGAWYKNTSRGDFFLPTFGMNFGDFKFFTSYAMNLAYKKNISPRGNFEVSLAYSIKSKKSKLFNTILNL